ncbi:MAG: DUF6531 domain-containing protein [Acidimicrobiales bacterium]
MNRGHRAGRLVLGAISAAACLVGVGAPAVVAGAAPVVAPAPNGASRHPLRVTPPAPGRPVTLPGLASVPGRPDPARLAAPRSSCPAKVAAALHLGPTCAPPAALAHPGLAVGRPPGRAPCPVPAGKGPATVGACTGGLPPGVSAPKALAPKASPPTPPTSLGTARAGAPAAASPPYASLSPASLSPDSLSSNGYSAAVAVTSHYLLPGAVSTVVAFSNVDVGPTPYYLEIYQGYTLVTACGSGTYCEAEVSVPEGAPQAYGPVTEGFTAAIGLYSATYPPLEEQAASDRVFITWDLSELLGGSNPAEPAVSCTTTWGVSCATGNFYRSYDELSVPGRGVPLKFSLTYNPEAIGTAAPGSVNPPLPFRWTDSYNMYLELVLDGSVVVYQENGSTVPFAPGGAGGFTPYPEVHATLSAGPGGTYVFSRRGELISYVFDSTGKLIDEVDPHGYVTSLSYQPSGQDSELASVTDPEGRSLRFYYDASGNLALVVDPDGSEVGIYDSTIHFNSGRNIETELTGLVGPLGGLSSLAYTNPNDASHLTGIVDPNGSSLATAYDCPGICQAGPGRNENLLYNTTGGMAVVDPDGNDVVAFHTGYLLTYLGRAWGTPQQAVWAYGFDTSTREPTSVTDPAGRVTTAAYDLAGDLVGATDATGAHSSYAYDAAGQVTSSTNPDGGTTSYGYDPAGDLTVVSAGPAPTSTTTLSYDGLASPGDLIAATDPDGRTTTFAHDTYGNVVRATDPAGATTSYAYDGEGRVVEATDPRGGVSTFAWAGAGPGELVRSTDPRGFSSTYTYDADGNLASATDASLATTAYTYDAYDEVVGARGPGGQVTTTSYDPDGNVVSLSDALGTQAVYSYNALGQRTSVTDALGRASTYRWDASGAWSHRSTPRGAPPPTPTTATAAR